MKKLLIIGALTLIATTGFSNEKKNTSGWISSGGILFKDAFNPWFVKNISDVAYCISVDSGSFSATEDQVKSAVTDAISYWKEQFQNSSYAGNASFIPGTQNFNLVSCDDASIDIRFVFGVGKLSADEVEVLEQPSRYIGVSVRTDYDKVNLRAKGFVYISSDMGESSYHNGSANLIDNAWLKPQLLRYALVHELGHVFGLPHQGTGIMSEVFLDLLLDPRVAAIYETGDLESFLHPKNQLDVCSFSNTNYMKFFDIDGTYQCVRVQFNPKTDMWAVSAKKHKGDIYEEIGKIRSIKLDLLGLSGTPASVLKLSEEQTVYDAKETLGRSFLTGPLFSHYSGRGVYISNETKKPKNLYFQVTPSNLNFIGQVNGTSLESVFTYNSTNAFLLTN